MLLVCFADGDAENEEIIAEIAMKLRKIGDSYDSTVSKGNYLFFDPYRPIFFNRKLFYSD